MSEMILQSSLSWDEINANFDKIDFFESLKTSLESALSYERGEPTKATVRKMSLPDPNSKKVRAKLKLTQKAFAELLSVSQRTVEAWESGKNKPTPTARKLINAIDHNPELINVI